jgi:hypothetical protein
MLYVRTEQRPGSTAPEHLFVTSHDRQSFTRWLGEIPPQMELIIDTEGRQQASEQEWLTLVAEHERNVAYRLLKKAVRWLPVERARELRQEWRDSQPPEREAA